MAERKLVFPLTLINRLIGHLQGVGFFKEREVAFPHKQAALMKIGRDGWRAPAL